MMPRRIRLDRDWQRARRVLARMTAPYHTTLTARAVAQPTRQGPIARAEFRWETPTVRRGL